MRRTGLPHGLPSSPSRCIGVPLPRPPITRLPPVRWLSPWNAAIARLGAFECLRSGVTTVGDASFSGASATACDELGLRAIVYLEVFGTDDDALERFHRIREEAAAGFTRNRTLIWMQATS